MYQRIDKLAALGTTIITISGGEPLLHPELDDIIRRIRLHGIIAGMITNGYLLTAERIQRLNRAGLEHLQISIDNVTPDEVSKKSLKVLDKKLQLLAEHAEFHVNINSVVGGGIQNPQDALIDRQARAGAWDSPPPWASSTTATASCSRSAEKSATSITPDEERWRRPAIRASTVSRTTSPTDVPTTGAAAPAARYLYICEDGLVHYCSQQRGYPAKPLAKYTLADVRREYLTEKSCAPHCTVSCVHQISYLDFWRAPQSTQPIPPSPNEAPDLVQIQSD